MLEKFREKMEFLSTLNLFFRKFAAVCRKIAPYVLNHDATR